METEFYLPDTFSTQDSAIEAAIQAGRQKIDMGFERGSSSRERVNAEPCRDALRFEFPTHRFTHRGSVLIVPSSGLAAPAKNVSR